MTLSNAMRKAFKIVVWCDGGNREKADDRGWKRLYKNTHLQVAWPSKPRYSLWPMLIFLFDFYVAAPRRHMSRYLSWFFRNFFFEKGLNNLFYPHGGALLWIYMYKRFEGLL